MADLIERDAALEIAMSYCPDDDGSCSKAGHGLRKMLDEIEELPIVHIDDMAFKIQNAIQAANPSATVEINFVRHGRWETVNPLYSNVYCSECGAAADKYLAKRYKGCPFCLCVMDATDTNVGSKGGADNG